MKRLWIGFVAVIILSFLVLGWIGTRIYQEMPPIPDKYVTTDGVVLIDSGEVGEGNADYAIPANSISSEERLRKFSAFVFWTSWAASTTRPGDIASYTNNWPHEPLVGNRPTGDNIVWTGVSVIMLLANISGMAWWYASRREEEQKPESIASHDPLARWKATPSQKATIKYFWVVAALIFAQMGLGIVTAHYGVEGDGFYGFPLAEYLPYSVSRTWHVQIRMFWIATAWLAAGLFIGPLVSNYEPKLQRLGVNVLFAALLLVVVGSLAGEWLSVSWCGSFSDYGPGIHSRRNRMVSTRPKTTP